METITSNPDWAGIATLVTAVGILIVSVLTAAAGMFKLNQTHDLVNSQMTKFKEETKKWAEEAIVAAMARGELKGQERALADRALRDQAPAQQPAAGPHTILTPGKVDVAIDGTLETKK